MAKGRLLSKPAISVSSNPKEMYSLCLLTMVLSRIHDIYIQALFCDLGIYLFNNMQRGRYVNKVSKLNGQTL